MVESGVEVDKMELYSNNEYADMHLILGECRGNGRMAVRRYAARFPNRRLPNRATILGVDQRLRETGKFAPQVNLRGRRRGVRNQNNVDVILQEVNRRPNASLRQLVLQTGISKNTIHRILKDDGRHPYHIRKTQCLEAPDPAARLIFCRDMLQKVDDDNGFFSKILFTDESHFSRNGMFNIHNEHRWAVDNPHALQRVHHQRQFSLNLWAGILGDHLLGPVRIPNRFNGENYLEFLNNELQILLEALPLNVVNGMWYMQDGAPPHYARTVRDWLNQAYPDQWIGRGNDAPINWPARSPDLNPLDFFFWGTLKNKVYAVEIETEDQLWQRILEASIEIRNNQESFIRVRESFAKRINTCIENDGGLIEHLL